MRATRLLMVLFAIALAGVYGAADQYLGSRVGLGEWTVSVSQMSAPWLVIAFLAGTRPRRRIGAVTAGLAVTMAAVAGYFFMTLSPMEGVSTGSIDWSAEIRSQLHVILPALATGPLFGWLGGVWRDTRSPRAVLLVAALFICEPLVRLGAGQLVDPRSFAWPAEVAIGLTLAALTVLRRRGPQIQ